MTRFIHITLIFAFGLLFASKGHAQVQQKQGKISFTNVGVPVGLAGMGSKDPAGYTKYYLCFTDKGVPSHLSSNPVLGTPVLDQPFACPIGITFQMRIIQYEGSITYVAEQVNDSALAWNEMVVRIQ